MLTSIILVLLLAAAAFMWLRGQSISECTYAVPSRTGDHVRIVALADLHGELPEEKQETFVQRIQSLAPDLIVYLGDMIDRSTSTESAQVLESLTGKLMEIAPVCYVDGNHEQSVRKENPDIYASLKASLAKTGGAEGSEYLGTMIISGGLAGEHGVPRINNPKEISVIDIDSIY